MRRLTFALLLLSLGMGGRVSSSNAEEANLARGGALRGQLRPGSTNTFPGLNGNSAQGSSSGSILPGINYATTAQNWSYALSTALTGCPTGIRCATQTITLPAGILGIDVTTGLYQVYISDGANSEAVAVTGGTYIGGRGGTVAFTPYYSHTSYTVKSATSGIQETVNLACGTSVTTHPNGQCNVTIPANGGPNTLGGPTNDHPLNNYQVYGTIYFHAGQSILNGYGVSLNCLGRGPCLQLGDLVNANRYADMTVKGIHFRTPVVSTGDPAYAGSAITSTVVASSVATITTSAAHGFHPGDIVVQQFTDDASYWGDAVITTVPTSTTYTYSHTGGSGSIASQTTPGVTALAYEAVLDNANSSHFIDVSEDAYYSESRRFNNFFDMWDDENAVIDHFNNNAISLNGNANWSGSFVFSGGAANVGHQLAPVITIRDSNFTANASSCVTDYNSNGLYFENSVCQSAGLWQVYASNSTGNYQGAYLKDIYTEGTLAMNPAFGARTPFPGLGIAGLIAGPSTSAASFKVDSGGSTGLTGGFATGGSGSAHYSYFIVVNDVTSGGQTSPMQVLNWLSTGSDSIPVSWPRVAHGRDTITYDVIRMTTPRVAGDSFPYIGGCPGGSGGTCGSVATALSQAAACTGNGGLMCQFVDTGSSTTSAYTVKTGGSIQLNFWPGTIVTAGNTIDVDKEPTNLVVVGLPTGTPALVGKACNRGGVASSGGYTACLSNPAFSGAANGTATLLYDGAQQTLSKGRLNLFTPQGYLVNSHHFITLLDSQPGLTQSTIGYRPPASANDTWIGTDIGTNKAITLGQLSFGAPVAISSYINNTGDGTSWLERLTSKQKTFAVPVRIITGNRFTLGDGSPLSQMTIYRVDNVPGSPVPPQSCADIVRPVVGLTQSDQIAGITPPAKLGNLSLNVYAVGADTITLHFCNPSGREEISPPGAYSFLAVH